MAERVWEEGGILENQNGEQVSEALNQSERATDALIELSESIFTHLYFDSQNQMLKRPNSQIRLFATILITQTLALPPSLRSHPPFHLPVVDLHLAAPRQVSSTQLKCHCHLAQIQLTRNHQIQLYRVLHSEPWEMLGAS